MIQKFYKQAFGRSTKQSVLTHCKWELIQAIWNFLLDADFLEAYQLRMIINFVDGIVCQVYLQIITYAADYPEK